MFIAMGGRVLNMFLDVLGGIVHASSPESGNRGLQGGQYRAE
jgi:hypothetical protein